jgi:hypothetical protein
MGATSVTGISGDNKGMGSAEGSCKGTERMSLGVKKLIGPHAVVAESANLVGGTLVFTFPTLPGVAGDYIAVADSRTANRAYVSALTTSSITKAGVS